MSLAPHAPIMPFTPIKPIMRFASAMPTFDPSKIFTLKFRGRSVIVPRDCCSDYDDIIAVAQRSLRSLQSVAQEDIIVMALVADLDPKKEVEVSKEAWPHIYAGIGSVTLALESDLRSSGDQEYDSVSTMTSGSTSTRRSASPVQNRPSTSSPHVSQ